MSDSDAQRSPRATRANWQALRKLARSSFKQICRTNPDWTVEKLLNEMELPDTAMFRDLASEAGFRFSCDPTQSEMEQIQALTKQGVKEAQVLFQLTKIPIARIRRALEVQPSAYGMGEYGTRPYGQARETSDGLNAVPRRITNTGQFSYKGHLYSLGTLHAGRLVHILERQGQLICSVSGACSVTLTVRH